MSTKERLIEAAEERFATRGYGDSSLRDITGAADANLAAVHYHFGNKEALLREIVLRRTQLLSAERERLLSLAEDAAGENSPTVRSILKAFIEPVFDMRDEHPHFPALMGRLMMENLFPVVDDIVKDTLYAGLLRFSETLADALPGLKVEDIRWRLFFTIGVFQFLCNGEEALRSITGDDGLSAHDLRERVVDFCEAGISAPVRANAPSKGHP